MLLELDRTIHTLPDDDPPSAVITSKAIPPTMQMYPELQRAFDWFNDKLFDGQLPQTLITLQRGKQFSGFFRAKSFVSADGEQFTHEIALNPDYFEEELKKNPLEVLQTLAHEMAHLWQHEFGQTTRRAYHNKQFAEKMREIGLKTYNIRNPSRDVGQGVRETVIKDGLFEQAAKELNFDLRWMSRTPGRTAPPPPPLPILVPFNDPNVISGPAEPDEPLPPPPPVRDPKQKITYQCPVCKKKVWGAPGLEDRLFCSIDKSPFFVVG